MSHPSDPKDAVVFFLEYMLRASGWSIRDTEINNESIYYYAQKEHGKGKELGVLEFVIRLAPGGKPGILLLAEFSVVDNPPGLKFSILPGHLFLSHYGKGLAREKNGLTETKPDPWEVKNGANLQTLFASYDELAEWVGYKRIFSPEKTK
jgi:hypothetical protein